MALFAANRCAERAHSSTAEQGTHNPLVTGSNPVGPISFIRSRPVRIALERVGPQRLRRVGHGLASPFLVSSTPIDPHALVELCASGV
jgi:hypothetical protein